MKQHSIHPLEPFRSAWRNRTLIWQMGKRDVIGRYRGSIFGLAWSFFNPLLMLLVYTFVFSIVLKARLGGGIDASGTDFAIFLFAGLIVFNLLSECINRAPSLILSNVNFVKKVLFPLEVLPFVTLGSALFHTLVSFSVLMAAIFVIHSFIPWTAIFFLLIIVPLLFVAMGMVWFLAATGVYIRDIGQSTGIISAALLFLAPVFYPMSTVPEKYRIFMLINPLTFIIEEVRQVLIWGHMPNWSGWGIYSAISICIAWAGFWWFQKTRKGFADVL